MLERDINNTSVFTQNILLHPAEHVSGLLYRHSCLQVLRARGCTQRRSRLDRCMRCQQLLGTLLHGTPITPLRSMGLLPSQSRSQTSVYCLLSRLLLPRCPSLGRRLPIVLPIRRQSCMGLARQALLLCMCLWGRVTARDLNGERGLCWCSTGRRDAGR